MMHTMLDRLRLRYEDSKGGRQEAGGRRQTVKHFSFSSCQLTFIIGHLPIATLVLPMLNAIRR